MKNNRSRHVALTILLLFALLAVPVPDACAQSNGAWSVAVLGGFKSNSGAKDLEQAMRAAGFDETATGLFGGGIEHPFSTGGGSALAVDVSYAVREPWAIGVAYVRGSEGRVLGFNGNPGFQNLTVQYSVSTFAPKLSGELGIAYASAGPALHRVKISAEETGGQSIQSAGSTSSKLGFLAEAGVRVPLPLLLSTRLRIVIDVKTQYRYVGQATAGPYTPAALFGATPVTFPATTFSLNDWFFGVGPGVRF